MWQLMRFADLIPVDPTLYFQRGDPNDVRLGEIVGRGEADYDRADVVILGFPEDEGVRRNGGRVGAAQAPTAIRRCLYRLGTAGLARLPITDLGDTPPATSLEERHAVHQALVQQIVADGKLLIVLGGGNDVAYPDYAGLAATVGQALAFTIDAHYDIRADTPRNSGTPYRQLLDEQRLRAEHFCVLGTQPFANSITYTNVLIERGAQVIPLHSARVRGLAATVRGELAEHPTLPVFWGFDMDVVQAAEAPGVSAPNPLGMSGAEFCMLAELAGAYRQTRLIEISEVCPPYDIDQRTCRLAATAIWYALAARAA